MLVNSLDVMKLVIRCVTLSTKGKTKKEKGKVSRKTEHRGDEKRARGMVIM